MKFTIRVKLLIGFTLLLVLSSFIHALTFNFTRQYITAQVENQQISEAEKGASEVQRFFSELTQDSQSLATLVKKQEATTSASTDSFDSIASYLLQNKPYLRTISLLAPQESTLDQLNNQSLSDAFTTALSGNVAFSSVYFVNNEPHIDLFLPVLADEGDVLSVIRVQTNLMFLQEKLSAIRLGEHGFVYLVDNNGRLLLHPSPEFMQNFQEVTSRALISNAIRSIAVTSRDERYINENNISVVAKVVEIPTYQWFVVFEQPESEAFGFLLFIRNLFIVALVGSFIFLLLISLFLSENLTSPIRKLQKSAKLLEAGQLTTPISINSGDEIETLSHVFATMVNQLLQRERSLQQEKHDTDTLLQSLTDGVVALDQSRAIIAFNKAAEQSTGFAAASLIGKNVDQVLIFTEKQEVVPFAIYSQQTEKMMQRVKNTGLHLTKKDGQRVVLGLTVKPLVFESQKRGFLLTFYDKSKEQELEEMKLDFVSMAAHELRTPLTAIRGYASLLQLQAAKFLDPGAKELINRLVVSSEKLGNLIENLLSVSRIERSAFVVDARPVDLTNTIRSVIDGVKQQAVTKKQTLTLLLPNNLPVVRADAFRVGQVLLNLVANAIHYTQDRGTIIVNVEQKDSMLQVSVKDNGRGIPKEALPKLFSKFFRVSGSLEQGAKGTGLGLYISKSIITMHKGKIWAESEGEGKGSIFAFALPIMTPEEMSSYQQQKAQSSSLTGKFMGGMMGEKK